MNDFELESKLKAIKVPAREEEYWGDFPRRVRSQLGPPVFVEPPRARLMPQWAWNSGLALTCVCLSLLLWPVFHAALLDEQTLQRDAARLSAIDWPKDYQDEQAWQRDAAKLPKQLHLLLADEHGMQDLVAERD